MLNHIRKWSYGTRRLAKMDQGNLPVLTMMITQLEQKRSVDGLQDVKTTESPNGGRPSDNSLFINAQLWLA